MSAIYRSVIILACVGLVSCAATRVVERAVPVEVTKEVYVPLPYHLLEPCGMKPQPLVDGISNGELRQAALQGQWYATCLDLKLQAIRDLQPK